jgi:flagellar FliL protein
MSKPAKPAAPAAPAAGDQPPKSKKMLIIIIAAVVLLGGGGAAAFFMMKPAHPDKQHEKGAKVEDGAAEDDEEEGKGKVAPKFVELGTYTANLVQEDADRMLQVEISIKLTKPELEEKVKERSPEIKHRINMLLQSKRASELASVEGKEKLAQQIKQHIEFVMGLRKVAPSIQTSQAASKEEGRSENSAESAPARKGIAEVLFTSFIIQ